MDPAEFWSLGDYSVIGDLWAQAGRDIVASLTVENKDIVDLATGTGVSAIAAARRGGRSVIGVDVTQSLLEEAAHRAETAGVKPQWVQADMHQVPLGDNCADLVISTFGLIFSAEPLEALNEAKRLVRTGGEVVFSSWSSSGMFSHIRQALAPYFPDAPAPWHEDPEDIRRLVGPQAIIREGWFTVEVNSPETFVDLMEKHSAPIILGAQSLGPRWPEARDALLSTVRRWAEPSALGTSLRASYLVTSVPVP
ncbi:class I SAM-dependent methyltransferase [Nesterenkonia haasae]|uniref:class I SAM-dependent methyltransferase n=1 Tax=Nesterenkonia haasae TaxID=2587813 RepID=UPI001390E473|nr:class I SAM-dependent methyltransferase [Nesterenkonia haasae]NDK33139.1 class I SAM-dependent methyltransferase [Nesterenkonia haasae]